jgi:hypothetical protein
MPTIFGFFEMNETLIWQRTFSSLIKETLLLFWKTPFSASNIETQQVSNAINLVHKSHPITNIYFILNAINRSQVCFAESSSGIFAATLTIQLTNLHEKLIWGKITRLVGQSKFQIYIFKKCGEQFFHQLKEE